MSSMKTSNILSCVKLTIITFFNRFISFYKIISVKKLIKELDFDFDVAYLN